MFKFSIIIASIIIFIACSKPKDANMAKERASYQKQLADKAYQNLNKELE